MGSRSIESEHYALRIMREEEVAYIYMQWQHQEMGIALLGSG